ncbi:MAG: DUF1800 family protein [Opitutaceae bacterium]|nr:DUF1800 family protein [Opitutaceae bacterium]
MKTRRLHLLWAALAVAAAPLHSQQPSLSNLSTRAQVGTGGNILISGFNIGPGGNKTVLVRASGPALAGFGVAGTVANPRLQLFNGTGTMIAENDDWNTPVSGAAPLTVDTFNSVGAFGWTAGSRDAALIATLAPGAYTAQVSGVGNTTGVALVEVYEVGQGLSRLSNLSTRAQVGTGANILIPGLVVSPGTGARRLLIRAAGPALTPLGVTGALADPTILVTNAAGTPAFSVGNDNWSTPSGTGAAPASEIAAAAAAAGAFAFAPNSRDAAMIVDVPPGNYTIQTSGVNNTSGVALVEVYDLTPAVTPVVTIVATRGTSDESGRNPGEFTFYRTGDLTFPLTVNYTVGGSAVNGFDYPALLGTFEIPAGAASAPLTLSPNPDVQNEGTDTVSITVAPRFNYNVGTQSSATVTIADSPATLYIASIRTTPNAVGGSTASGYASILLSSSGTLAAVNVTFTGLSSTQVTAHLVIGSNEDYVLDLPNGQVGGVQWLFTPTGAYTSAQLLDALRNGNIGVRIDSAKFPGGELKGAFRPGAGSQAFTPPAAPPAPSLTNLTANEAARFLTQTTFGPTKAEIDALTGGSVDAWITAQLALPFTSHRAATVADRATFGGSNSFTNWNAIHPPNRQSAWFKTVLTAPDQLRQRMAYALSQILVISDITLADDNRTEPVAHYYDQLGNGAFGNFRTLLETVTLSPMMGEYLSSVRNSKATFDSNGVAITTPDENYAREIMQLFTIGLVRLQPDGTLQLGPDGLPIPTYDQTTITELAKVFTGWSYFNTNTTNANNFRGGGSNYINPMSLFPAFHDNTAKNLAPVSPTPIPANTAADSGTTDLRLALDALFNHPNTAPFISKLLIQRLVTSNPSPGYVYRVAQKFENNGAGTRGDLAAVARAILTDYEARSPAVASNVSFGKLKEPLLRLTALMRGLGASSESGRFMGYRHHVNQTVITSATPRPATQGEIGTFSSSINIFGVAGQMAQAAMRSPTVFNFYHADYVQPGTLAAGGLVAPEFEITDDNFAISVPNYLRTFVNSTTTNVAATIQPYVITLNTTYEETLLPTPSALVDHLNRVLAAGNLTDAVRARIVSALAALPAATTARDRVNTAILLVLTSPAAAIQK